MYIVKNIHPLKTHISEHISFIKRSDMNLPIGRHFHYLNHEIHEKKLTCTGIKKLINHRRGGKVEKNILKLEAYWIH